MNAWPGVIEQYRARLPVSDATPVVTLLEGNTPLLPAPRLAEAIGFDGELYLKYEGLNPTASFKDRGMTMAMSKAKERGAEIVICASTGNTSAAASAYASRGGLKAAVLIPDGKIALGKLAQARMYGAEIVAIEGNFDDALRIVRELGELAHYEIVNSINPVRIEGQKTAAFEICDALGKAPDFHFLPVGNAGNITAYWKGFQEYQADGTVASTPRIFGFQAKGAAPIVDGHVFDHPETVATAIRIGNPASWKGAENAAAQSNGFIGKVSDEAIIEAYKLIAANEGVFVEPACAAPIAGLKQVLAERPEEIPTGSIITATMTGHGLKDPATAIDSHDAGLSAVPATTDAVRKALGA